jgi:hypothetical protein
MSKKDFFRTYNSFLAFVSNIKYELVLICPFIKLDALKVVLEKVPEKIRVVIIARWRISDLVLGSSDLEVYTYLRSRKSKFFINQDIHLKVLIKDKKDILLGSANITKSGLGLVNKSNIEVVTKEKMDEIDIREINKILKNSIEVDDGLFKHISKRVKEFESIKKMIDIEEKNMRICDDDISNKASKNILVADFPFSKSPTAFINGYLKKKFDSPEIRHDMILFNLTENETSSDLKTRVKREFLSSDAFSWQKSSIKEETLFGKYCYILHETLMDDPKPFRKQIKELVSNMFTWTEEFSTIFKIKQHRHTCSISRK